MAKKKTKKQVRAKPEPMQMSEPILDMLGRLDITIAKTADGLNDYVQIASGEVAVPVNIVLIADEIVVCDRRGE